jgi:replicative DNA helicase
MIDSIALDIDADLVKHLGDPNSVAVLQSEQVRSTLIEDPAAVTVFEWQMDHVRNHGVPAKKNVLEDEFGIQFEEPDALISDLVERLRQRYMRNEGRQLIRKIAHMASENPLAVAEEMQKASRQLSDLVRKRGETYGPNDFNRAMSEYDKRVLQGPGPTLGFKELDQHFNGIMNLTFLIATPKTYKSWFTIKDLYENVIAGNSPYLYSLELPALDSEWRLACMASGVPYWKYLKASLSPDDRNKTESAMEALRQTGNFNIEKPAPGERTVHRMVERALEAGSSCIFIDQLQYMENRNGVSLGAANQTGDYWEVCQDLRDYSDQIPIFVVHQFNRSAMSAQGKLPEMQQVKGSSAIEETGTLLLALHATKEQRKSNIVEVGTLATRNFEYKSWHLGVSLSTDCDISMIGEVEDEEEDE